MFRLRIIPALVMMISPTVSQQGGDEFKEGLDRWGTFPQLTATLLILWFQPWSLGYTNQGRGLAEASISTFSARVFLSAKWIIQFGGMLGLANIEIIRSEFSVTLCLVFLSKRNTKQQWMTEGPLNSSNDIWSRYPHSLSTVPAISWTPPLPGFPGEFSPRPRPTFRPGDETNLSLDWGLTRGEFRADRSRSEVMLEIHDVADDISRYPKGISCLSPCH